MTLGDAVILPDWLDWTHVTSFGTGVATVIGILIARRNLSAWRDQRRHDARAAAAVRVAELLLRAAQSLEQLRFRAELSAEGFVVATTAERSPDRVVVRAHDFCEGIRDFVSGCPANDDLTAARTTATIHLPEADHVVELGERIYVLLEADVMRLRNSLDGGPPGEEFHAALGRIKDSRFLEIRHLREQVAEKLGPIARHDKDSH